MPKYGTDNVSSNIGSRYRMSRARSRGEAAFAGNVVRHELEKHTGGAGLLTPSVSFSFQTPSKT